MDEYNDNLVINKLASKAIYDYLVSQGRIGNSELYFIINDDTSEVVSVSYDSANRKLYYTDANGANHDIVTIGVLKTAFGLHTVATSGSYNDLSNQPRINNVTLSGNKTTSDLGISYNDLTNQPSIPQLISMYSASDETKAITGKGVANALSDYVPETRTVTGSGALDGGGALSGNVTITHKAAPTGLNTRAVTIGVDSYGHVQVGSAITASTIGAQPAGYIVVNSSSGIDASNKSSILVLGNTNENINFSTSPGFGVSIQVCYVNTTNGALQITIDQNDFGNYLFVNNNSVSGSHTEMIDPNASRTFEFISFQNSSTGEIYTFVKIL